jgi:hypothetical protein
MPPPPTATANAAAAVYVSEQDRRIRRRSELTPRRPPVARHQRRIEIVDYKMKRTGEKICLRQQSPSCRRHVFQRIW